MFWTTLLLTKWCSVWDFFQPAWNLCFPLAESFFFFPPLPFWIFHLYFFRPIPIWGGNNCICDGSSHCSQWSTSVGFPVRGGCSRDLTCGIFWEEALESQMWYLFKNIPLLQHQVSSNRFVTSFPDVAFRAEQSNEHRWRVEICVPF